MNYTPSIHICSFGCRTTLHTIRKSTGYRSITIELERVSGLYSQKQNTLVSHPSGGFSFGRVPQAPKFGLIEGEIYLRVGIHRGAHSGFGVHHIWEAHRQDLARFGCVRIEDVAAHISSMVVPGAPIYCEFAQMKGEHRVAVMKNPTGCLILEPRHERRGFGYYVVTWYPKRRTAGTLVAQVQRTQTEY